MSTSQAKAHSVSWRQALSGLRKPSAWFVGLGLFFFAFLLSLAAGAYPIDWWALLSGQLSDTDEQIIAQIRLPRSLLAAAVGATLAVCGAALQGLFRNPLADPGLIGVSSGAGLAVAIAIVWLPSSGLVGLYTLSLFAFIGSLITSCLVFLVGRNGRQVETATLILAGIAINAIVGAIVGMLTYISTDQQLRALTFWTMGSFGGALWPAVGVTLSLCLPAIVWLTTRARDLNRLLLGEEEAIYMGTDARRLQWQILLLVSLGVGVGVAFSGIIGFVGLVVPHLIRLFWTADHRLLMPLSAFLGASLTLLADTFARTWAAPAEMPVGIITSLIGGPFFLWLLLRLKRELPGT